MKAFFLKNSNNTNISLTHNFYAYPCKSFLYFRCIYICIYSLYILFKNNYRFIGGCKERDHVHPSPFFSNYYVSHRLSIKTWTLVQ